MASCCAWLRHSTGLLTSHQRRTIEIELLYGFLLREAAALDGPADLTSTENDRD